jgi:hypothetical protein
MIEQCPACDAEPGTVYRCQACGHDLVGDSSTNGRIGGNR